MTCSITATALLILADPFVAVPATVAEDPPPTPWRIQIVYRLKNAETRNYQRYRATLNSDGWLRHGDERSLSLHALPPYVQVELSEEEAAAIYRAVAKVINSFELKVPGDPQLPPLIQWPFELEIAKKRSITVKDKSNEPASEGVEFAIALLRRIHRKHSDFDRERPESLGGMP